MQTKIDLLLFLKSFSGQCSSDSKAVVALAIENVSFDLKTDCWVSIQRKRQKNHIFLCEGGHVIIGQPKNTKEVAHDKSEQQTKPNRRDQEMAGPPFRASKERTESRRILPPAADLLPCFRLLAEKLSKTSGNNVALVPITMQAEPGLIIGYGGAADLTLVLPKNISTAVGDNFSGATLNRLLTLLAARWCFFQGSQRWLRLFEQDLMKFKWNLCLLPLPILEFVI
jgi:hypothetical protein